MMTDRPDRASPQDGQSDPVAVVHFLSGPQRGQSQSLSGSTLHIELHAAGHTSVQAPDDAGQGELLGSLHRSGPSYELVMEAGCQAWVNGERATIRLLDAGDLVEVEGGPVLRFRTYPAGTSVHASPAQVFADQTQTPSPAPSAGAAIHAAWLRHLRGKPGRPRLLFRSTVLLALAALAVLLVVQQQQTQQIARDLEREQAGVQVLAESLRQGERERLTRADLAQVREQIEQGLAQTGERVTALESRSAAIQNVIADVARSVVFIQGSYGFRHEKSGRPLRVVLGPDGDPIRLPDGRTMMSLAGEGPAVEIAFTGTGFIVTPEGLMLSNRHVVLPWESQQAGIAAKAIGMKPELQRMLGFLPGDADPLELELVSASDSVDLAILRGKFTTALPTPLQRATHPPRIGDEVIVLGYPTGIRALLARSGTRFVDALSKRADLDLLGVTRELAKAGLVTPLASRGIVGQVTAEAIVYDAETTQGGSGGPAMNLDGQVVAVNAAILPGFGGSNIGIPIALAKPLLDDTRAGK